MRRWRVIAVCVMLLCGGVLPVQAEEESKLERVENKVAEKQSSTSNSSSSTSNSPVDTTLGFLDLLFGLFNSGPFAGLDNTMPWGERHALLRKEFHPALPTIRVEAAYQKLTQDVQGYNLNATVGYMTFGADFDWVHYYEESPQAQLKLMSPHVLMRFAPFDVLQFDFAVGAKIMRGRRTQAGMEMGVPVYININKHLMCDLKTYGGFIKGTRVLDTALGVSGKWKLGAVRAAYRLIQIGDETLHGPQVGLVVQW